MVLVRTEKLSSTYRWFPFETKLLQLKKLEIKFLQLLQTKGALQREDCSAAMTSLFLIAESIASLINHDSVTNDQVSAEGSCLKSHLVNCVAPTKVCLGVVGSVLTPGEVCHLLNHQLCFLKHPGISLEGSQMHLAKTNPV